MINCQYRVGGSLAHNHPTYVCRKADEELLNALLAGQFCYVFNSRQMGKSSLRVRTMRALQTQGMSCASVDITSLGSDLTVQQWYSAVITQLFLGFNLAGKINLKVWLREREDISPVQKLHEFIEGVLLVYCPGKKVFIFIDEIDKVLSLNFSLDDFFSLIRFCYNQRAENHQYNRIAFALFGVATPSDLIREKTQTSFNIGQAIELTGFTLEEVAPLKLGLESISNHPQIILKEILFWTGGQPFLTQKICQIIVENQGEITGEPEREYVKSIVFNYIINNWESQDEPVHLKTIRDRLLRNEEKAGRLLGIYQNILKQGYIEIDDSNEQVELCLSGLVVKRGGKLTVYNPIYQAVFNQEWVNKQLSKLRPYSESLAAWEASQFLDESRLLRGQALKDALAWAIGKSLSNLDYQFLTLSQKLDKQQAEVNLEAQRKANLILTEANRKATRRIRIGSAILIVSLLGAAFAIALAKQASDKQQAAQLGTYLQRSGETAIRQFQFEELEALLAAMEAGQALKNWVKDEDFLVNYPATSPLLALEQILFQITEKNQLKGHQDSVYSVSFSPDKQLIATASRDGTVKLWTLQGQQQAIIQGHQGAVYALAFSPDGQYLATASQDGTAKLWNRQGKLMTTFKGHQGSVYNLNFSPDGLYLATSSRDGTGRIWDLKGGELVVLSGHQKSVDDVSFSPDGFKIATASRDGTVRIWNLKGELLLVLAEKGVAFYSISFSPNGQEIAATASDGQVKIWNLQGQILRTLKGHQDFVNMVSFSPDGKWVATAASDGTSKLWNRQGRELLTLKGHQEAVYDVAWSPDSQLLVTASGDGTVKLWEVKAKLVSLEQKWPSGITGVSFNAHQSVVAIASKEGTVALGKLNSADLVNLKSELEWIYGISFSPDGQYLGAVSRGGNILLWDKEGKALNTWKGDFVTLYTLSFHPQQPIIATGSRDGRVWLWNFNNPQQPQLVRQFKAHNDAINSISFSPWGNTLITASNDGTAKLWDLDGKMRVQFQGHQEPINWVGFRPDGKQVATASSDGTVRLWDNLGKEIAQLQQDLFSIQRIAYSPQGEMLASASSDGTVRVWDSQGNLRREFRGQASPITGLSFRADGTHLITVAEDGIQKEWPIKSESSRLNDLLRQGCTWLADYLVTRPHEAKKLPVCFPFP